MRSLCRAALWVMATAAGAATGPAPPPTTAPDRAQVSLVDATVEADHMEIWAEAVKFVGHVVIHAERVGRAQATLDLTADQVTLITGMNEQKQTTITKVFAVGNVHIEATTDDPETGKRQHVTSDCDRVNYIGPLEVIHFLSDDDQPIQAHATYQVVPTATNGVKESKEYRLELTGRNTVDFKLSEAPAEMLAPGGEG